MQASLGLGGYGPIRTWTGLGPKGYIMGQAWLLSNLGHEHPWKKLNDEVKGLFIFRVLLMQSSSIMDHKVLFVCIRIQGN